MQLQEILFSQGFGTRRACAGLIEAGAVRVAGAACSNPLQEFAPQGLVFRVDGQDWTWCVKACLMLHKPAGYECSHKPGAWPSVYSLLPAPLRLRPNRGGMAGVQAVGRLDQDTTGLLLLTDDGTLLHRLNSPRHHVPKVYEIGTAEPVQVGQIEQLLAGVVLDDDPRPVRAAACEALGAQALRLTLTEGKYHQVKRMVAAVGNQVRSLHRAQVGPLQLPPDLAPGRFRWLGERDVAQLRQGG